MNSIAFAKLMASLRRDEEPLHVVGVDAQEAWLRERARELERFEHVTATVFDNARDGTRRFRCQFTAGGYRSTGDLWFEGEVPTLMLRRYTGNATDVTFAVASLDQLTTLARALSDDHRRDLAMAQKRVKLARLRHRALAARVEAVAEAFAMKWAIEERHHYAELLVLLAERKKPSRDLVFVGRLRLDVDDAAIAALFEIARSLRSAAESEARFRVEDGRDVRVWRSGAATDRE